MSVVGLDFGYQNSVIAAAGKGGVDVILNGNSNRLNPSMVGFDDCRRMGELAVSGASSNYKNTIHGMKRLVGLAFDACEEERKQFPFQTFPFPRKDSPPSVGVKITLAGEESLLPIELVAGMMIRHMGIIAAEKAAQSSNQDVKTAAETLFPQDWVVAIPNSYTDAQRRGLQAGCDMVGISVQRFIHENTATALAFGIFKDLKKVFVKDEPHRVMFIDMGATALSVSIAAFEPGKLTVESAHCDTTLGGRAFDLVIAEWIAGEFEAKYKSKLSGKPMARPKTRLKLLAAAEKAKKTLSPQGVKETPLNLEMLMDDLDFHCSLKAKNYEEMITPLLDRLEAPIRACLAEAKLDVSQLSAVELVGGSTRIGAVKRRLQEILGGMTLSTTMNADEAVARGAALQSAILSPRFKVLPYEIVEAQPFPVKVAWGEDESSSVVMFERGVSFPVVKRVTLKRTGPFQVKALYSGEAPNEEIATFDVKMPNQAEEKKVRVNIKADISGILSLSSAQMMEETEEDEVDEEGKKKIKATKTNLEASTKRPLDWSSQEIAKYHETEVAMANVDRIVRETADMQNELESYIYDMRDKIHSESHYGPYGTDAEKAAFTSLSEQTETWLYEDGFDAKKSVYADKLAALQKLGAPMENRKYEAQHRPKAIQRLQNDLNYFTTWVNESQADEKYAHITDDDRNKVRQMTDQVSGWMYEKLDQQGNCGLSDNPVLTVAELEAKCRSLHETCGPVKAKPKPKPVDIPKPAAPEPAPAETPAEPMETDGAEEPMETD